MTTSDLTLRLRENAWIGDAVLELYVRSLILKQEGKRTVRGNEIEGETVLGDYKDVDGMLMPFSLEQGMKGSPQKQKMTFDKYELNVPMEDSRFKMPAVAAAADSAKAAPKAAAKAPEKAAAKKGK